MSRPQRYGFCQPTKKMCALLKISPERVAARAGLPLGLLDNDQRGVTGDQVLDIWQAVYDEADEPDIVDLGKRSARGPFNPAVLAFSCSPTVEIGLRRLAKYKPLVGPVELICQSLDAGLEVTIRSRVPRRPFPPSFAAFELAYFLELMRSHTAAEMIPVSAGVPKHIASHDNLERFAGVALHEAETTTFVLSNEDSSRELISEGEELWPTFEKSLTEKLLERERSISTSTRVRSALLELLPSGHSTADAVSSQLNISKRSLHRYLSNEGQTFQTILDETRTELSLHYLRHADISVEEISFLLAYNDPNSFYRAFRSWTGMTPLQARETHIQ